MGVIAGPGGGGEEVSPEREARSAFERGMKALNRRPYTQAVMADLLTETGFSADAVESAVGELVEIGAIDDSAYAVTYAAEKRELAGWGSRRIAETLRKRGVGEPDIELALAADNRDTELDRAVGLLESRGTALEDDRDRNRALAYLTRRGYDLELAYDAVRRYENA